MPDLSNVIFAIYLSGRLFRSGRLGNLSYGEADATQAQLERDYPGCRVEVQEF